MFSISASLRQTRALLPRCSAISVASCSRPARRSRATCVRTSATWASPGRSRPRRSPSSRRSWSRGWRAGGSRPPAAPGANPRGAPKAPEGPWTACRRGSQTADPAAHLWTSPWRTSRRLARAEPHTKVGNDFPVDYYTFCWNCLYCSKLSVNVTSDILTQLSQQSSTFACEMMSQKDFESSNVSSYKFTTFWV